MVVPASLVCTGTPVIYRPAGASMLYWHDLYFTGPPVSVWKVRHDLYSTSLAWRCQHGCSVPPVTKHEEFRSGQIGLCFCCFVFYLCFLWIGIIIVANYDALWCFLFAMLIHVMKHQQLKIYLIDYLIHLYIICISLIGLTFSLLGLN